MKNVESRRTIEDIQEIAKKITNTLAKKIGARVN